MFASRGKRMVEAVLKKSMNSNIQSSEKKLRLDEKSLSKEHNIIQNEITTQEKETDKENCEIKDGQIGLEYFRRKPVCSWRAESLKPQ